VIVPLSFFASPFDRLSTPLAHLTFAPAYLPHREWTLRVPNFSFRLLFLASFLPARGPPQWVSLSSTDPFFLPRVIIRFAQLRLFSLFRQIPPRPSEKTCSLVTRQCIGTPLFPFFLPSFGPTEVVFTSCDPPISHRAHPVNDLLFLFDHLISFFSVTPMRSCWPFTTACSPVRLAH